MRWLGELENLVYRNNNRRVVFSVDSEVVQDDSHSYWYADNASVSLKSILDGALVCGTQIFNMDLIWMKNLGTIKNIMKMKFLK